jgi:hypothetical protein
VTTTDALFALKVQRKESNGIAGLAAADHFWIDGDCGNSGNLSDATC